MNIEIWSKDGCSQCVEAERLAQIVCQESHNTYNKLMLNSDFTREELLNKFPNARTFPQIVVDGNIVGGLNQFTEYLQENV